MRTPYIVVFLVLKENKAIFNIYNIVNVPSPLLDLKLYLQSCKCFI